MGAMGISAAPRCPRLERVSLLCVYIDDKTDMQLFLLSRASHSAACVIRRRGAHDFFSLTPGMWVTHW